MRNVSTLLAQRDICTHNFWVSGSSEGFGPRGSSSFSRVASSLNSACNSSGASSNSCCAALFLAAIFAPGPALLETSSENRLEYICQAGGLLREWPFLL